MTYTQTQRAFGDLRELVQELYIHEPVGGPLHIVTDDGNIEDHHLVFCYRWLHEKKYSAYITSTCKAILHELMLLTEAQRLLWWLENSMKELGLDSIRLAFEAKEQNARIEWGENGCYDAKLVGGVKDSTWSWPGLKQIREEQK